MSDESISARIERLVAEEHDLRSKEEHDEGEALASDRERLKQVEIELDQSWDLLRQRRALRETGGNPEDASVRDEGTVEGYLQ